MKTVEFFATHPVFSLDQAAKALVPDGRRSGMVERLKYHLRASTLKLVTRGVYAVVHAADQARQAGRRLPLLAGELPDAMRLALAGA